MNEYEVKSLAIIAGIAAIHQELSRPALVASYRKEYGYSTQDAESALMGLAQEITFPLWVEWQSIQLVNSEKSREVCFSTYHDYKRVCTSSCRDYVDCQEASKST